MAPADKVSKTYQDFRLLYSAVSSLYDEFDKLAKKVPNAALTDLSVVKVNFAISDAKELMEGDRYVDRIAEFVPAGQNPVNSDVLLVLSELRAALRRFRANNANSWARAGLIEAYEAHAFAKEIM